MIKIWLFFHYELPIVNTSYKVNSTIELIEEKLLYNESKKIIGIFPDLQNLYQDDDTKIINTFSENKILISTKNILISNHNIYFKFDSDFIRNNFEISGMNELCNIEGSVGAFSESMKPEYVIDFLIIDSFYELSTPGDAGEEYGSQNALIRSLVNDIKIPKLITTQAKPDILSKKMAEVTENDIAFTKRAGHAADWIGYLRKDSKKSTVAIKNIKSRLRNFKIELAEVTYYSINISDGIYQEIKSSQAKYSDEDI